MDGMDDWVDLSVVSIPTLRRRRAISRAAVVSPSQSLWPTSPAAVRRDICVSTYFNVGNPSPIVFRGSNK